MERKPNIDLRGRLVKLNTKGPVQDLDAVGLFLFAPLFLPALIVTVSAIDGRDPIVEVVTDPVIGGMILFSLISAVAGALVILRKRVAKIPAYLLLGTFLFGFPIFTALGAYGLYLLSRADKAGAFDDSHRHRSSETNSA